MTKQDIKYIEKLLAAFFDGTTTVADEKELNRFFRQEDVPEHLKPYIPVFAYFETGLKEECRSLPKEKYIIERTGRKRWYMWAGIAASLLLFVSVGIRMHATHRDFNPYEGSYIIRNGVRIDDPEAIKPQLILVMERVSENRRQIEQIFKEVPDPEEKKRQIEEQVISQQNELLNRFENEGMRKRVQEIFNITPIN